MEIRLRGKQSVYLGIVEEYKKLMETGAVRRGEKLPSCRALAVELGINPNTVERAYSVLEREGYILVLPKKGAYAIYGEEVVPLADVKRVMKNWKEAGVVYTDILAAAEEVYADRDGEKEEV